MTPPFRTAAILDRPGLAHGFFGRRGGASTGLYDSLNAGVGSNDDPDAVAENRRRVAAVFGLGAERLLTAYQVHSARAVRVSGPWTGARPEADALVTTETGLAIGALAADCAPVLFADAEAGVIAAAHAGWKGALAGVLEATVEAMIAAGAAQGRIVCAVGPCIAQASYEVGPEFRERFLAHSAAADAFFRPGANDRSHFDLPGYCAARLAPHVGGVEVVADDTCAQSSLYFSNRRATHAKHADYGRNISVICRTST